MMVDMWPAPAYFGGWQPKSSSVGVSIMSRLIMWNLISLDGFFEGTKSWKLDWHQTVWGPELEALSIQQLSSADRLLFGRITYEGMAAHWRTAQGEVADFMNRLPKFVFSRTLSRIDWSNATLVSQGAVEKVADLKRQGDGNTFVFGSGNLSTTLINHGLFDEYRLAVTPTILGSGRPLFAQSSRRMQLKLLEARSLSSGCVILRYEPADKQ
jgi:dihydrofolate reductase